MDAYCVCDCDVVKQAHYEVGLTLLMINLNESTWLHNWCSVDLHDECVPCMKRSVRKCDHLHVTKAGVKELLDVLYSM